jgi:hypothetical protein
MRTALTLIGLALLVIWLGGGRRQPQRALTMSVASGAESFDFAAETPIAWDRMYVFGGYSPREKVEQDLGFAWPEYEDTSIHWSDSVNLVVFARGNRVMTWFEQPRVIELGWLDNGRGYSRTEAHFRIERENGRVSLTRGQKPLG